MQMVCHEREIQAGRDNTPLSSCGGNCRHELNIDKLGINPEQQHKPNI